MPNHGQVNNPTAIIFNIISPLIRIERIYTSEYRNRRNNPTYNNYDGANRKDDVDYYQNAIEDDSVHNAFKQWRNIKHSKKISKTSKPYHLDVHHAKNAKMSKPSSLLSIAKTRRNINKDSVVSSRLNRLRLLEDRLQHIEQMKQTLQHEIREILRSRDTQLLMKPGPEISQEVEWEREFDRFKPGAYKPQEVEWEREFDRFKPGAYKPLTHLRDETNLP